MRPLRSRNAGFTLVEIAMTAAILAMLALMLSAGISTSRQMDALGREKVLANNAIRAYIEDMRRTYPGHGTLEKTSMWQFLDDPRTPVDYLPTTVAVASTTDKARDLVLHDPRALVLKCVDETGAHWGPAAGTLNKGTTVTTANNGHSPSDTCGAINLPFTTTGDPWTWSDSTMTSSAPINTSTTAMTANENACCAIPYEDVDGDGLYATTGGAAGDKFKQLLVPTQITISWQTESNTSLQARGIQAVVQVGRQSVTVYATFGFEH